MYVSHLYAFICFFFFFCCFGRTGIEPVAPAVEVWSLSHWTTKEVPIHSSLEGHLGGSHILAATKKASVSTVPYSFLMLSNLTFNKSLQNLSRKQILFSRGLLFPGFRKSSPGPSHCPLQHHHLALPGWAADGPGERLRGDTYHTRTRDSTAACSAGAGPPHMGRTWALGDKRPQGSEEETMVAASTHPAPHRLCAMATSRPTYESLRHILPTRSDVPSGHQG